MRTGKGSSVMPRWREGGSTAALGSHLPFPSRWETEVPRDPAVPLLGLHPPEVSTCAWMFTAALL